MRTPRTLALALAALATSIGAVVVPAASTALADVTGAVAPTSVAFTATYENDTSASTTVTLTGSGTGPALVVSGPATISGPDPTSFKVTADHCNGMSLGAGDTCTVSVAAKPQDIGALSGTLVIPDNSPGGEEDVPLTVTGNDPATGLYYKVASTRILDTRSGLGASKRPVKGGSTVHLQVLGRGHVPASGASAVVLNLTVTHTTTGGHVTAFPSGSKQPNVSNINYAKGWTGANLVTVPIGAGGKIDLYNSTGSADLIADVQGWYASSKTVAPSAGVGGAYFPMTPPFRVMDTRSDGNKHEPLPSRYEVEVAVAFDSIDADQIHALAITLTGTGTHANGYLTATQFGADPTRTSTLNLRTGVTTPNLAIVSTVPCSESWCLDPGHAVVVFVVYNGSPRAVDVLADVQGAYIDDSISTLRFHSLAPRRIVDTRISLGTSRLGAKTIRTLAPPTSVAGPDTAVLAANVTAVLPSRQTVITVWPHAGGGPPRVSNLNPRPGVVVATGALIGLGDEQKFSILNNAGTTDVLVDVSGAFDVFPPQAGSGLVGARGRSASGAARGHAVAPVSSRRSAPMRYISGG